VFFKEKQQKKKNTKNMLHSKLLKEKKNHLMKHYF